MSTMMLLSVDAALEAATGLALILFPGVVIWLLFAAELPVIGVVLARLGGVILLALSLGCWLGRRDRGTIVALGSMLAYNILTTAYFASLGVRGELVGPLLWPAIVFHAVVALLLATAWTRRRLPQAGSRE
jgi:hypothetical protein